MYARISLIGLPALALALAACSSSSGGGSGNGDDVGHSEHRLAYVEPCTPADCDGLPVPEIGCADSSTPTLSCEPTGNGTCHIVPKCDGGADDPDEPVSYESCEESECGPIPQIGCPDGDTLAQSCGSENDGPCLWTITCIPPPSTTPCQTPDGCGPMPEIGVICDDGSSGSLACMQTGSDCSWEPQCP